ncbi:MAG: alpha-E domain-containing protein [Bacteroidales bacterium]|nr:alpha-E domain-containing protein [Bacteroidales bacterium]
MVKSTIISTAKANSLYWLGRYEERVYMTLHLFRKCYDRMIDGNPDDYSHFRNNLDTKGKYSGNGEFVFGMLYDEDNESSVISAQNKAMDNAILLRDLIMSETLSYLEMSVSRLRHCRESQEANVTCLQPVIDWSLAFWGSAEQRLRNHTALNIMMTGRNIENLDIQIRFGYSFERVRLAFDSLTRYNDQETNIFDGNTAAIIDSLIVKDKFNLNDISYKNELLTRVNKLTLF